MYGCLQRGQAVRIKLLARQPQEIEFGIIFGGIAVLILLALRFTPVMQLLPGCVFKGLTSIPCPTCGATRAALLLARGEATASLNMNPLVSLCFMSACLVFSYSLPAFLLHLPRLSMELTMREQVAIRVAVVLLVMMNWAYLVFAL
jgi:hypothetical protein